MAETNSLRVVFLFEAGARLGCSSEIIGLAAHIYHRFLRKRPEISQYELYSVGSACLKLAHWFYEQPLNFDDLVLILVSLVHGSDFYLEPQVCEKLKKSIDFLAKVIAINLEYQIDYKDSRMITPGDLLRARSKSLSNQPEVFDLVESNDEDDDEYHDSDDDDCIDLLLSKNSRNPISSHRYLIHYLKSIKLMVDSAQNAYFLKLSNLAWVILTDFHWSPSLTQHRSNHIACACLMIAIEIYRPNWSSKKITETFWKLVNKKWNLIFCEDLNNQHLERIMNTVVKQYLEYERIIEYEFSIYVIDPKKDDYALQQR